MELIAYFHGSVNASASSRLHGAGMLVVTAEVQLVLVDDTLLAETPRILYFSLQCLAATVMAILSLGCLLQVGGRLEGDAFDCWALNVKVGLALRTISRIEAGRIAGIHCTKDSSWGLGEARKDKADMIPSYATCVNIVIFWISVDDVLQTFYSL